MSQTEANNCMPLTPKLDDDAVTKLLLSLALFMIAAFVVFTPAWLLDPRILDGANVWTKPQKFNISLSLHFFTLALIAQQLPREIRTGWPVLIFAYLAAIGLMFEFVYVALQAGRARRSHFNFETVPEQIGYALMGLGAFLLIAIAFVMAIQLWRKADRTRKGLWLGSIFGLLAAFVTTLIFGFYMSSTGRYVGGELDQVHQVVPFFGWSREFGDLRPAHFVSLHMMQTLPLAGYLADRFKWPAVPVVVGVGLIQLALATGLFVQALSGKPFWPL